MHAIAFTLKRAHLGILAFGRDMLKEVGGRSAESERLRERFSARKRAWVKDGAPDTEEEEIGEDDLPVMTPARFDLLHCLCKRFDGGAEQFMLRERLGLHSSTVSKMIKRLVQLRILDSRRCDGTDRRRFWISITQLGKRLYHQALQIVFGGKKLATTFERLAWAGKAYGKPRSRRRWQLHGRVIDLHDNVTDLALRFGDTSGAVYQIPHEHDLQPYKTPCQKKTLRTLFNNYVKAEENNALTALATTITHAIDNDFENAIPSDLENANRVVIKNMPFHDLGEGA